MWGCQDPRGGVRGVQRTPLPPRIPPTPSTVRRLQEHLPEDGQLSGGLGYLPSAIGLHPMGSPE